MLVIKLDNNLNPVWSVSFGDATDESASDIILAPNGNYFIAGKRDVSNKSILAELNPANGSVIQMTELGTAQDRMPFLIKTLDNRILSLGHLESFPSLNSRNKLTTHLLDAAYTSQNRTIHDHFNGTQPEPASTEVYCRQALQLADSTFLVLASHAFSSGGNQSVRLIHLDKNTNVLSIKGFDFAEVTRMMALTVCTNGDIVLGGYSNNYTPGTDDVVLMRLDGNGVHLWSKFYQTTGKQECLNVLQTDDDGFLLTGNTNTNGFGQRDVLLVKTDSSGSLQWAKVYGDTGDEEALSAYRSGAGYLVTGSMFTPTNGNDLLIMQVDSSGEAGTGCAIDLTPLITPVVRTPVSLTRSYGTLPFTPPVATSANQHSLPVTITNQCPTCPQADFTATDACAGDTVFITANYGANDSIISWDYGDGFVSTGFLPFYVYSSPGNYTIEHIVYNPVFACYDTFSSTVTIHSSPVFSLGADTTTCGTSYPLFAPVANNYLWNTGQATTNIAATSSGTFSVTITDGNGCTASDSINISFLPTPNLDAGTDQTICENQCATLNASGSMNFTWYPNPLLSDSTIASPIVCPPASAAFVIHARSPQNHIINGDFEAGNTGFTSDYTYGSAAVGTYQVAPDPNVFNSGHFGSDHTSGTGNFLIADGSTNAFNAAWCQTVTIQPNTDYDLSLWANNITDAAVNVNDPIIQITINGLPVCGFGGTPLPEVPDVWVNIACTWNSGGNTSANICIRSLNTSVVGNDFGIDDITFTTPDGCLATDTTWVFVQPALQVDVGNDTVLCTGNTLLLDAGNAGSAYLWNDNSTMQTLLVSSSGSFSVQVTDSFGCIGFDTIEVTFNPAANAQIDSIGWICFGSLPITLTATPPGGVWHGQGITDSVAGVFNPSVFQTWNTVYYSFSGNCGTPDTFNIEMRQELDATIFNPGPVCSDEVPFNIQAATSGGFWFGNGIGDSTSSQFDPSVAGVGNHTIVHTFPLNCPSADTIIIAVLVYDNPVIEPIAPVCGLDETILLQATPAGGLWFGPGIPDSTIATFFPGESGTGQHEIYYTDNATCPGWDTVSVIVHLQPLVHLGSDTALCLEEGWQIGMNPLFSSFVWSNGSDENPIMVYEPGLYSITITDTSGCQAADTILLEEECLVKVEFPTAFTPNSDGVNDWFHALGGPADKFELSVWNRWGEQVFHSEEFTGQWDGSFRGKGQPVGTYVWKARFSLNEKELERSGNVTLIR